MNDWLRSLAVLSLGFIGVIVVTLGLANVIVYEGPGAGDEPDELGLGGDLVVTGDREGTVTIHPPGTGPRVELGIIEDGRFSMTGDGLRIAFEADPFQVAQVSYDGLSFFPEEGDCMVTPRDPESDTGISIVELHCEELTDVRGNGAIGLGGEIGLPIALLVERTFPDSGGSVTLGDELWEFNEAAVFTSETHGGEIIQYKIHTFSGFYVRLLGFAYDSESGEMTLLSVERDGMVEDVPESACDVSREELGEYAQILVTEIVIRCASFEVPGLGAVPIEGAVIVDETQFPDQPAP